MKYLDSMGETKFANYSTQMDKVRDRDREPADLGVDREPLLVVAVHVPAVARCQVADSGYPSFMTNDAWTRKDLNTVTAVGPS